MAGPPFYVGYRPQAPPEIARFTRRLVLATLVGALLLAALLAGLQRPFDPGTFEFLTVRELVGVVRERPYPALTLTPEGFPDAAFDVHLVLPGKRGAAPTVAGLDGRTVALRGKRIHRGGSTLLEIAPPSLREVEPAFRDGSERAAVLGVFELTGEIVDGKCYLGAMKPGREKTHRACAALCIRGGIPAFLAVEAPPGDPLLFLLADAGGAALGDRLLDLVGEPVTVRGRVERLGGTFRLLADRAEYRRSGPRGKRP